MILSDAPSTIEICTDCVMFLANGQCEGCESCVMNEPWFSDRQGEPPTCQTVGDRMAAVWPVGQWDITLGHRHSDNCCPVDSAGEPEPFFAWSDCEGCGSSLAGDRQYATVWPIRKV